MKNDTLKLYYIYFTAALISAVAVWIYYRYDMACISAAMSQSAVSLVTVLLGMIAIHQAKVGKTSSILIAAIVALIVTIIVVPTKMIHTWGFDQFLVKRLIACSTIVFFAVTQIATASIIYIKSRNK